MSQGPEITSKRMVGRVDRLLALNDAEVTEMVTEIIDKADGDLREIERRLDEGEL